MLRAQLCKYADLVANSEAFRRLVLRSDDDEEGEVLREEDVSVSYAVLLYIYAALCIKLFMLCVRYLFVYV